MNPSLHAGQRRTLVSCAIAALTTLPLGAQAFSIDTGNPDVEMRWDNSFRYNLGVRAQAPNAAVLSSPDYDDGDRKFDRGDIVTNRLDLLSEMDISYRKQFGFRISGNGWYDQAYDDTTAQSPYGSAYPNAQYTDYVKRYNRGPSGELADLFLFGHVDLGSVPVDIKAGRHNVYWGESFFSFIHSVANSQSPVDIRKLGSNPGVEAKELFKPLNQISAVAQLTNDLTLGANYYLQWRESPFPDGGTFLGPVDWLNMRGGTYVVQPIPGLLPNGVPFLGVTDKPKNQGDWGVRLGWAPEFLDGNLGFYYRKYTDKLPQLVAGGVAVNPVLGVLPTDIRLTYMRDVKIIGMSLGKQVGPLSVGAEVSYRKGGALLMGSNATADTRPRGDTWHALVNIFGAQAGTALYDSSVYIAELTYSRLAKVTEHPETYGAVGYGGCPSGDKFDNCATRDNWGIALRFEPKWNQVFSGINLTAPMFINYGLRGNSPVLFGGNEGSGAWSLGVGADIFGKYTATLAYNGNLLRYKEGNNAAAQGLYGVTSVNGFGVLRDRGWVSLTVKATF